MNRIFVSGDFDAAGAKVGQAVLNDDVKGLNDISKKLDAGLQSIKQWVGSKRGVLISGAGDEFSAYFENIQDADAFLNEIEQLRHDLHQIVGATITVGVGLSLSQAGKSLLAGKLSGKDMLVPYDNSVEHILHDAHQHVSEGQGSDEEIKQDDHYISHIDGVEDQPSQDMSEEPSMDAINPDEDGFDESYDDGQYNPEDFQDADLGADGEQEQQPDINQESDSQFDESGYEDADLDPESMDSQGGGDMEEPEDVAGGMMDTAPDASEDAQDEFAENEDSIRSKIDEAVGAPEEEGTGEEEIEIPESEHADLENDQDPALASADEDLESEAFNQMNDEAGAHISGMKQQVAEALMAFKAQKPQLEAMQQQAPELYMATLTMLQTMLDLSKALFGEAENPEMAQPEPEASPDMQDEIPAEDDMAQPEEEFLPKQ